MAQLSHNIVLKNEDFETKELDRDKYFDKTVKIELKTAKIDEMYETTDRRSPLKERIS